MTFSILRRALVLLAPPLLLGACAASYERREAPDDALLRISQDKLMLLKPAILPINAEGKCEKGFTTDSLSRYAGPVESRTPASITGPGTVISRMPREAMLDSPPPERSDTIELRLRPGAYLISGSGVVMDGAGAALALIGVARNCAYATAAKLEARGQYWLELGFEGGRCSTRLSQVQDQQGTPRWAPADPSTRVTSGCGR